MSFWKQVGAYALAGLVTGGLFLGGTALTDDEPAHQDLSHLATAQSVNELSQAVADLGLQLEDVDKVTQATSSEILSEVNWEAAADVLAQEELEDDDYEELREWVLEEFSDDFADATDAEDIEDFRVDIRDTDFEDMDHDDQDGTVVFELKVEYETDTGDDVNRYVTATATLEDGEVEDLSFDLTE